MRRTLLLVVLTAACSLGQQAKMGGVILGRVQSDTGAPVGAAWVPVVRDYGITEEQIAGFSKATAAQPNGSFSFSGLAPGGYHLCAHLPGSKLLNPCEWSSQQTKVQISKEQLVENVVVTMRTGVKMPIRIHDPQGLLKQHEKHTPGAHVLVGVVTPGGGMHPAEIKAEDDQGRDQELVIPVDAPASVVVFSSFFKLAGDDGAAVQGNGAKLNVPAAGNQNPKKITITVTGAGH